MVATYEAEGRDVVSEGKRREEKCEGRVRERRDEEAEWGPRRAMRT